MSFWMGLFIGIVIGCIVGFCIASLMVVAGRSEEASERDFQRMNNNKADNLTILSSDMASKKDKNEFERRTD